MANILLREPGYRNKYPPLGLMKLAAYHRARGDTVTFLKGDGVVMGGYDRIYITTLFSFEYDRYVQVIDNCIANPERVFVGGIAASLMPDAFAGVDRWRGVRVIPGLLDGPPREALRLTPKDFDYGDTETTPIERMAPDYGILDDTDYQYPVHDAYFGYASRGCVRKCAFCGVPKLEGELVDMPPLRQWVDSVAKHHGEKRDLILMDNNITALARYSEVLAEIRDCGFAAGAKLNGRARRVDFNQGVDARIIAKSDHYMRDMATVAISPLRVAFDHIGLRKPYEKVMRMAAAHGIRHLSNYMLFNFMDKPTDLWQRCELNIALNEELGIRIWSFPMRYAPVDVPNRSHVGKHWHPHMLRSMRILLNPSRGVVGGNHEYFHHVFGGSADRFEKLLWYPHALLAHREHYQANGMIDEYESLVTKHGDWVMDAVKEKLGAGEYRRNREHASERVNEVMAYYRIRENRKQDSLVGPAPLFADMPVDHVVEDVEFS